MNEPPTAQWARNDRVLDTSSETSQGSPSIVATRLLGASAVACAPALIELLASILGTRSTISITVGAMLGGLGVGAWCLIAWAWVLSTELASRATFGWSGKRGPTERLLSYLRLVIAERGTDADIQRMQATFRWLFATLLFVPGSAGFVYYLVEHRHGSTLIAATAGVGQLGVAVLAWWLASVMARIKLWSLRKTRVLRWCSTPLLWLFLSVGVIGALIGLAVTFWEIVVATDGLSLALPAFFLIEPLVSRILGRRLRFAWKGLVPATLIAATGFVGCAQSPGARSLLMSQGLTARYVLRAVLDASDIDGDGSPSFPIAVDCSPFDPTVHPIALELPGNGVDENCDGKDTLVALGARARPSFKRSPGPRPNLILVTFDAPRAAHLGYMGYKRNTSPALDALAAESVVFERGFSQDSGTGPSLWALMSGKTPFQVKLQNAHRFPPKIHKSERTLAEVLRKRGYSTVAVLCGDMFDSKHWNLRRGFQRYKNVCGRKSNMVAPKVTQHALAALKKLRKNKKPFFLWVHYLDAHKPYKSHPKYDFGKTAIDNYDEEIRYSDHYFGKFLRVAKTHKKKRPTYIAVGADHGENFNEHGSAPHARNLYREVTNVPMMIWGRDLKPRRITAQVALGDYYPTFIELARLKIPKSSTMVSQVPVLFGGTEDPGRIVFQENSYARPRRDTKGALRARYHYIMDVTTQADELYDYVSNPEEDKNLLGTGLPEEIALRQALVQFLPTTHVPAKLSR